MHDIKIIRKVQMMFENFNSNLFMYLLFIEIERFYVDCHDKKKPFSRLSFCRLYSFIFDEIDKLIIDDLTFDLCSNN